MKFLAIVALLTIAMPVQAVDIEGELPCRFKDGLVTGTLGKPAVFTTNLNEKLSEEFKTSIGALTWELDSLGQGVPVLNGKRIPIRPENQGNFYNGKVHDLGGKILLAYQVIRMEDPMSSPSSLTLLVGEDGKIIEEHLVPNELAWGYPCSLVY